MNGQITAVGSDVAIPSGRPAHRRDGQDRDAWPRQRGHAARRAGNRRGRRTRATCTARGDRMRSRRAFTVWDGLNPQLRDARAGAKGWRHELRRCSRRRAASSGQAALLDLVPGTTTDMIDQSAGRDGRARSAIRSRPASNVARRADRASCASFSTTRDVLRDARADAFERAQTRTFAASRAGSRSDDPGGRGQASADGLCRSARATSTRQCRLAT